MIITGSPVDNPINRAFVDSLGLGAKADDAFLPPQENSIQLECSVCYGLTWISPNLAAARQYLTTFKNEHCPIVCLVCASVLVARGNVTGIVGM